MPDARWTEAIGTLRGLGVEIDETEAIARAHRDGMFVGKWVGMRIDVFVAEHGQSS